MIPYHMGPVWYPDLFGSNPQCVWNSVFLNKARSVSSQEAPSTTDGTAETAAGADGGTTNDISGLGTFPELVETWILHGQSCTIV